MLALEELEETFLSMCQSSRAIIFRSNNKTQWQMFLLLYGRHVCIPQKDTNMASPYWKPYKFGWHTSANSARMKNSRDLILGKVVYISIIYRMSDSWLFLIEWLRFLLVKTENIKTRSLPAALPLRVQVTQQATIKWSIVHTYKAISTIKQRK